MCRLPLTRERSDNRPSGGSPGSTSGQRSRRNSSPEISIWDFHVSISISQTAVLWSCELHFSSGSRVRPDKTGPARKIQNREHPSFQRIPQNTSPASVPGLPDLLVPSPPATPSATVSAPIRRTIPANPQTGTSSDGFRKAFSQWCRVPSLDFHAPPLSTQFFQKAR